MNIKDIWKKRVEDYQRDAIFLHRFASYSDAELRLWVDALYRNEIIFRGSDRKFHIPDFSKMDFRGPELDHPEWVQQLNRFRWLLYASAEYKGTGSEHMAKLVYDAVKAWMDYWPYYGDRTDIYPFRGHEFWDPMISTPIRLGFGKGCGWVGCLPEFFEHPLFTDEFISKVHENILWQLKPMVYNNKEKSGEYNWRPNELDSLLFVSSILPGAEGYQEYAVQNLNDTFIAQFENDGSHIEHTPDYHGWMTEVFVNVYLLGRNRPRLGLEIDKEKLIKAIDYELDARTPDRRSFGIHDSWPWHVNNEPESFRLEKMRETIIGLEKTDGNKENLGTGVNKENLGTGVNKENLGTGVKNTGIKETQKKIPIEYKEFRSSDLDSFYPDAGQYFFRNNRENVNTMFYFDAGRWGSWHCHLSRNSVNLYHRGRMLLIDPGSLDYGYSEIRDYGKYTTSHNTVSINGLSQCIYANPEILESSFNEETALLVSSYQGGYQDLIGDRRPVPAEHERIFIWVRDRFAIVFDNVNQYNNKNENHISCHWQLPEGKVCHNDADKSINTLFDDSNVYIKCVYSEPEAITVIHEGEKEPLLGYISRTGGKLSGGKPAPMFSTEIRTNAEFSRFCHLIVPYSGTRVPSIETGFEKTRYAMKFNISIDGIDYEVASHYFTREYFKTNSAIREIGELKTFARVAVIGTENGKRFMEWTYK